MKCLPLMAVATLGFTGLAFADLVFAGSEPAVSVSALRVVEDAVNKQFQPEANDPWDYLGDSRGSYLPGYGAAFTFEMSLVNVTPINPFHAEISPQEKQAIHARKIKKLPVLKNAMRDLLVHAATTLTSVPPAEQITFEAFLDYFSFEDRAGLPRRLTMTASRQKILDAIAHHASPADFDTLIEVREEQ